MNGFKPVKKAKAFSYNPRFYDPNKEARDQRRAELRGSESTAEELSKEYQPGEYIRRSSAARNSRRASDSRKGGRGGGLWFLIIGVSLLFLLSYALAPRLVELFVGASETKASQSSQSNEFEEFNPYAPIRIVPNDYNGE